MIELLTKADWRHFEQVIDDLALHSRKSDAQRLFGLLRGREVFVTVAQPASIQASPSSTLQLNPPVARDSSNNDGNQWLTASTCSSMAAVRGVCGALPWEEFLRMTLDAPLSQGARLEGARSMVTFLRSEIPGLMAMAVR